MNGLQKKLAPLKWIFSLYIGAIMIFSLLYALPISRKQDLSLIDILFLSSSGISVTGLTTFDISANLTRFGQLLLLIQMQIGGIGIMVAFAYFFIFIGKKFSLPQLVLMSFDQNQKSIQSIRHIMVFVLLIAFVSETIGFLFIFPSIQPLYESTWESIFVASFHSVSSFTGSGFDLFGNSLYSFQTSPVFLITTAFLIFLGSIGFPVIIDVIANWNKKKSLFTKTNLTVHLSLIAFGFLFFLFIEKGNSFLTLNTKDLLSNALFLSVTARNGGLSTTDVGALAPATLLILLFLMFIGSSSSSCGGGIRTTTFAVLISKVWCTIRGNKDTILFKKRISEDDVNKSIIVFFLFSFLFFASTLLLSVIEDFSIMEIAFEVVSALTTTGLSMGITSELSAFSKVWLTALMLIGRVGVVAWIYVFLQTKQTKIRYVEEPIIVG